MEKFSDTYQLMKKKGFTLFREKHDRTLHNSTPAVLDYNIAVKREK